MPIPSWGNASNQAVYACCTQSIARIFESLSTAAGVFADQTVEGIYTLEDKTWTICATAPGAPEGPAGFDDERARTLELKQE